MRRKKCKLSYRRTVLRLPDLDHSKLAVLNSLTSPASRRVYQYAIDQFTAWVLLGASPSFQSHRCRALPRALPNALGISRFGREHDQSATRSRASSGS